MGACKLWQKPLVRLPRTSAKKINQHRRRMQPLQGAAAQSHRAALVLGRIAGREIDGRQHQTKLKNVKLTLK